MPVPNAKWQPGTGKQVILKSDFIAFETAILNQGLVRMQPPLVWVDASTVRVEATADCEASMQLTGLPNILNPSVQVSGGISDGKVRTNTANVSMAMTSGGLYGSEKNSQWYVVYALAGNADTTFTLKAMPIMRVRSQAGQVISLGTLITPATGIGYGFATNELIGGKVYFFSGASRGLMRTISANNSDAGTGGTITYSGAALTVAAGDWFIVLPPTNFRMTGTIYNNSAGNIVQFRKLGNRVQWLEATAIPAYTGGGIVEGVAGLCPFATEARIAVSIANIENAVQMPKAQVGHPSDASAVATSQNNTCDLFIHYDGSGIIEAHDYGFGLVPYIERRSVVTLDSMVELSKYFIYGDTAEAISYSYPPGCGY